LVCRRRPPDLAVAAFAAIFILPERPWLAIGGISLAQRADDALRHEDNAEHEKHTGTSKFKSSAFSADSLLVS